VANTLKPICRSFAIAANIDASEGDVDRVCEAIGERHRVVSLEQLVHDFDDALLSWRTFDRRADDDAGRAMFDMIELIKE
jgi:hypothetical protein